MNKKENIKWDAKCPICSEPMANCNKYCSYDCWKHDNPEVKRNG